MARGTNTDARVTLYRALITRTYRDGHTYTYAAGPYHTAAACKLAIGREQREGRWYGFTAEGKVQEAEAVWMDPAAALT